MRVVFFGATRGIGRALARKMAARGDRLFLIGRDEADLARSGADLAAGGGGESAGHAYCDLEVPASFEPALDRAAAALGRFDTVVLTAATFETQERLEADPDATRRLLEVDLVHAIGFCEAARRRLLAQGGGTLCVFSSVAGDRGRRSVGIYGAAKAGLSHYLESLDHGYRLSGLRTICIKPGFVRTSMTAGLSEPPFAADAGVVAACALRAIDRGTPVAYAPPVWRLLMAIVRGLPRFAMRRLEF